MLLERNLFVCRGLTIIRLSMFSQVGNRVDALVKRKRGRKKRGREGRKERGKKERREGRRVEGKKGGSKGGKKKRVYFFHKTTLKPGKSGYYNTTN